MGRQVIPQQIVITCDRCGKGCDGFPFLKINMNCASSYDGCRWANQEIYLCSLCETALRKFLDFGRSKLGSASEDG